MEGDGYSINELILPILIARVHAILLIRVNELGVIEIREGNKTVIDIDAFICQTNEINNDNINRVRYESASTKIYRPQWTR